MTEQEEVAQLAVTILANANIARKARLFGDKGINAAIEESKSTRSAQYELLQFVEMFMRGIDREEIFRKLNVSLEAQEKLTNYSLSW